MRGDPKAANIYYDDDVTYTGDPGSVNNPMIIEDFWDLIESTPTGLKSINDLEYFNYRRYCKFVNDIDFNDYPKILDGFMDNNFPLLDGGTVKYGYFIRFTDIDGNGCSLRNLCMIKYNKSTQPIPLWSTLIPNRDDEPYVAKVDSGDFSEIDITLKTSFLNLFCKKGSIFGKINNFVTCVIKNLNIVNLIMFQCRDDSLLVCDGCFGVASYDYTTYTYNYGTYADILDSLMAIKFDMCNFGVYINGDSSFRSIFLGNYNTRIPSTKDTPRVTLVRCTVNIKGILNVYNTTTNGISSNYTKQIIDVTNIKTMYCHLNYNILNIMQTPSSNNYSRPLLYILGNTAHSPSNIKAFGFNYITGDLKILYGGNSSFGFHVTHSQPVNSGGVVYGLLMDNCYINANIILYGTTTTTNAGAPMGYNVTNVSATPANLSACFINLSKIRYYSSYLDVYVNTPTSISTPTEQATKKMYLLEDSQCKDYNYLDSIGFLVIPAT